MMKSINDRMLQTYAKRLSDRDIAILESLAKCTFMLTGQIQRLHNTDASTQTAALRATAREMKKLKEYGLVKNLDRRIGGVRGGSSSLVWHLSEAGYRLLELDSHEKRTRKRHLEPSPLPYLPVMYVSMRFVSKIQTLISTMQIQNQSAGDHTLVMETLSILNPTSFFQRNVADMKTVGLLR